MPPGMTFFCSFSETDKRFHRTWRCFRNVRNHGTWQSYAFLFTITTIFTEKETLCLTEPGSFPKCCQKQNPGLYRESEQPADTSALWIQDGTGSDVTLKAGLRASPTAHTPTPTSRRSSSMSVFCERQEMDNELCSALKCQVKLTQVFEMIVLGPLPKSPQRRCLIHCPGWLQSTFKWDWGAKGAHAWRTQPAGAKGKWSRLWWPWRCRPAGLSKGPPPPPKALHCKGAYCLSLPKVSTSLSPRAKCRQERTLHKLPRRAA